jgi:hypothetical protein
MLAARASVEKVKKLSEPIEKDRVRIRLFLLLWQRQCFADLRHSLLLPYITKW